jgi:phosphoribosylformylglycinamidine synthase
MKFTAHIDVMPLKELLDPQGKAVTESLHNLGLSQVQQVRIGKHVTLSIEATSEAEARAKTEEACKKLLANQVMESYSFEIAEG